MAKRIAASTCLATVLSTLFCGFAWADDGPPPSHISRILERGELRIAIPAFDSAPFFSTDASGQPVGFDIDTAKSVAKELGVKVVFDRRAKTFDEVVDIVAKGEDDVAICKLSRTLRRARKVLFTEPYAILKHALIVNRVSFATLAEDKEAQEIIHDYRGTLGVIANSSFADYAKRNFPLATIKPFANWDELVSGVEAGVVVAAYRDDLEIKKLMVERPALALTLRTISLTDQTDTLGMAAAADDEQLIAYLNMYIDQSLGVRTTDSILGTATGPSATNEGTPR